MKLKFIALMILVIILLAPAYARLPARWDHVQVMTHSDVVYEGNITGLDRDFLCINCTKIDNPLVQMNLTTPVDVCIGAGMILSLTWIDS